MGIEPLWLVIISTLFAGAAMPIGAVLARWENIRPYWLQNDLRHSVVAFGGGALLSAVALVLVPEAIGDLPVWASLLSFCAGGVAFLGLDLFLARNQSPAGQLAAMLSDFVPESLALGSAFAMGGDGGLLLAGLMALQNLPEGFNAYRELMSSGDHSSKKVLMGFSWMALLGPLMGFIGYQWLSHSPPTVAGIMLFASGGILYSVFQDIAPQVPLKRHWGPALGAVVGFALGLFGHLLTK